MPSPTTTVPEKASCVFNEKQEMVNNNGGHSLADPGSLACE